MATLREYEAEKQRMYDQYGQDAEMPNTLRETAVIPVPVVERIADLARDVAEAAKALQDARHQYTQAAGIKGEREAVYAKVTSRLIEALHEFQEGTPEGVPYQP